MQPAGHTEHLLIVLTAFPVGTGIRSLFLYIIYTSCIAIFPYNVYYPYHGSYLEYFVQLTHVELLLEETSVKKMED